MRLRRVMTVLSGCSDDESLLEQGVALCEANKAHLDALFVRRNAASGGDFLGDAFSTYGMESVLEALDDAAALAAARARKAFDAMADTAPPAVVGRFVEYIGLPRSAMAAEGRLCDLILAAKPDGVDARNQLNAIETAAFESGRPVLVLPAGRTSAPTFDTIIIAWDGSLEASRAVIGAMPLLQAASTVSVIHAGADSEASEQLAAMAAYLDIHRVKAATQTVELAGRSPARALIDASTEQAADLLVMGGFGAPGWQRSLGRDDTSLLIKGTPFALLLAH
jgi:nucleotide-binding universal stress UspA family protein